MKPLFGGIAFKCSCGNTYIMGKGNVRLSPNEEVILRECRVNGQTMFFPAIKRKNDTYSEDPVQNIQYYQPENVVPSEPYKRNANELVKYGIYYVRFSHGRGDHLLQKNRPCIICSNVQQTEYTNTVTVIPLTTQVKTMANSRVAITSQVKASTAMVEQIQTVDTNQVGEFIGLISLDEMFALKTAMECYLGFNRNYKTTELEALANLESENYALRTQLAELSKEMDLLKNKGGSAT